MTPELIEIPPDTRAALVELATRTGRSPVEVLAAAIEEYRQRYTPAGTPVAHIPGVDPADVWEAAAQADAGLLTPHADVFTRLRRRP